MDIVAVFLLRFILPALAVLVLTYFLSSGVAYLISHEHRKRVALTQLIYVANLVVVGIPMVESTFHNPTYSAMAIVVLFFALFFHNSVPITQFELLSGVKESLLKIILNVFKSPIVLSIIVAALCNLLDLKLGFFRTYAAQFPTKPLAMLGHAASTMVFLCIGYNMKLNISKRDIKPLLLVGLASRVVVPLVIFGLAELFSLERDYAIILTILFASPTAPYLYNIMVPYDLELHLAQHAVVTTMVGYLLVMPFILIALGV